MTQIEKEPINNSSDENEAINTGSVAENVMDLEEAAIVAKVLARLAVAANCIHDTCEEYDLCATEDTANNIKASSLSTASEAEESATDSAVTNKKKRISPVLAIEIIVLIALVFLLGKYFHTAPVTPTQFADSDHYDYVSYSDGKLVVNGVTVNVPADDNVKYSVSYAWAEDDQDYPSVPQAAIASYGNASNSTDNSVKYDISLYKDSFTPEPEIPEGKTVESWFDDWQTSASSDVYQAAYNIADVHGFCISTLDSESNPLKYRTYSYYFAIQENDGVSVYVVEGTCYNIDEKQSFESIIKSTIESIEVIRQGTAPSETT